MNGIPYWFIFWSGFVVLGTCGMLAGVLIAYRSKMKTLEILRIYAERGTEPPAMLAEHLATPPPGAPQHDGWKHPSGVGHHLGSFAFSLFMAGAAAGVAWWWNEADKSPEWVFYAAVIAAIAFGLGGIAHFISAMVAAMAGFAQANAACFTKSAKPNPPPPAP